MILKIRNKIANRLQTEDYTNLPMQRKLTTIEYSLPQLVTLFFSIMALALLTRPYHGIWHDAILYTGQAIHLLNPEYYANDLFFMHGSQDNYTIFTNVYALLIDFIGINNSAMIIVITGQILWVAAAYTLVSRIFDHPLLWPTLAAIIVFLTYYSDMDLLIPRENFATPRLFAEGLALFSIAYFFSKKYIAVSALLLGSIAFHPLVGIGALIFLYFWCLLEQPRITLAVGLIGLLLILLIGVSGLVPFHNLFTPVDEKWFNASNLSSPQVYATNWDLSYWTSIIIILAFLSYASIRLQNRFSIAVKAILFGSIFALIISWFASETLSSVLLIQLQLWRILWLAQIFAIASSIYLLWKVIHNREDYLPLLGFIAAFMYSNITGAAIAVFVALYALTKYRYSIDRRIPTGIIWGLFILGTIEQTALIWVYISKTLSVQITDITNGWEYSKINNYIILTIAWTLAAASLLVAAFNKLSDKKSIALSTVSLTCFVFVVTQWDMRRSIPDEYDINNTQLLALKNTIKQDETVYWTDSPSYAWFILKRPSYYSNYQAAGLIFSRDTAVEALRRYNVTSHLHHELKHKSRFIQHGKAKSSFELTYDDIALTCSDPILNWLALEAHLPSIRMSYSTKSGRTWHFYNCNDFRSQSKTAYNKN